MSLSTIYRNVIMSSVGKVVVDTQLTFEGFWETQIFHVTDEDLVTNWDPVDESRWANEEEAKAGHKAMIEKWEI